MRGSPKCIKHTQVAAGIGAAVYATRQFMNLSIVEFGARVGVKGATVCKWEQGMLITTDNLVRIGAMAMGEARAAIAEELRARFAGCDFVKVVME